MNIQTEKLEIMRLILETDNPNILKSIRKLFSKDSTTDFWTTLPKAQKDEILEGLEQIENDETVKYNEFIKKHKE